jgi:transposase-like protein
MAKKGQKFKKYSEDDKTTIVNEVLVNKNSYSFVSKKYQISEGTIKTWIWKYKKRGNLKALKQGRHKTNVTEIERLRLENEILKKFQAFLKEQLERK